eukprot:6187045-Pleurochrysis_carterae.AAC.2
MSNSPRARSLSSGCRRTWLRFAYSAHLCTASKGDNAAHLFALPLSKVETMVVVMVMVMRMMLMVSLIKAQSSVWAVPYAYGARPALREWGERKAKCVGSVELTAHRLSGVGVRVFSSNRAMFSLSYAR